MKGFAFALVFLGFLALGVWLTFFAPCEVYTFSPTSEIPGRCVMR